MLDRILNKNFAYLPYREGVDNLAAEAAERDVDPSVAVLQSRDLPAKNDEKRKHEDETVSGGLHSSSCPVESRNRSDCRCGDQ